MKEWPSNILSKSHETEVLFFKVVPSGAGGGHGGDMILFLAQTGTYLPSMFLKMYILPSVSY